MSAKNENGNGLAPIEQDARVIPNAETSEMTKYRLAWNFTDEGKLCTSTFYLPEGVDPALWISDIINLVELSASEYGYKYTLKEIP